MPTSQWHHNKGGIGHSITLIIIIKSAYYTVCITVAKFVLEVCVFVSLPYVNNYVTKQRTCAQLFGKQMSKMWYKTFAYF